MTALFQHNLAEHRELFSQIPQIFSMSIIVPSQTTSRIQEAHIFIGHALCGLVEEHLGLA